MADFEFKIEGLGDAVALGLSGKVATKASQAINKTIARVKAQSARDIRDQVAFPANYLTGEKGRLAITKYAKPTELTAEITGRDRATSLARFVQGASPNMKAPTVLVKPGHGTRLRKAFLMKLRRGGQLTDTQFNLGLAIRLKRDEKIANKREMVAAGGGLYLLYGPSVAQVFRAVAEAELDPAANFLEEEFIRLMELKNG